MIKSAIKILQKNDNKLKGIIDHYGEIDLSPSNDYLFSLCKSIIGQQLSKYAAHSICNKFQTIIANKTPIDPLFLINLPDSDLTSIGISKNKVLYIKEIAKAFAIGQITNNFLSQSSALEIEKTLISIKGIGKWTVDMFLIFSINNLDIFPLTDAGIKKGVQLLYNLKNPPKEAYLKRISNNWKPYRSVAALYLWKIVDEGLPL